ncbi:hypothetical protein [Tenacibaculum ovolyticum]|uniref:hypothetical protein n=1 Tax=Tenacibaculum ovolyticum TaxID=104270 RepID=UPI003BABEC73
MTKDRNENFEEHSIFLSEIALNILKGNNEILDIPGVREIISLYLVIPYATRNQLEQGMPSKMPKLDIDTEFLHGVRLEDLRNTISHSFVSVEESTEERFGRIIVDDRSQMIRNEHDRLEKKTLSVNFEVQEVNDRLKELHKIVIDSI